MNTSEPTPSAHEHAWKPAEESDVAGRYACACGKVGSRHLTGAFAGQIRELKQQPPKTKKGSPSHALSDGNRRYGKRGPGSY